MYQGEQKFNEAYNNTINGSDKTLQILIGGFEPPIPRSTAECINQTMLYQESIAHFTAKCAMKHIGS